jgi:hypothetical protein
LNLARGELCHNCHQGELAAGVLPFSFPSLLLVSTSLGHSQGQGMMILAMVASLEWKMTTATAALTIAP